MVGVRIQKELRGERTRLTNERRITMALTGIMVTYPEGTEVPVDAKRIMKTLKQYAESSDHDALQRWGGTYCMYKPYTVKALCTDIKDFTDNKRLEQLAQILTLQDKSEDYKAITMRNGMIVAYAEGEVGECLRTALALGLGPMLNIRESNDY